MLEIFMVARAYEIYREQMNNPTVPARIRTRMRRAVAKLQKEAK